MLLLAHVVTGAVIGETIKNPILVSLFAFVSHFILDAVPHWNYNVPKKFNWWDYFKVTPDLFAASTAYLAFLFSLPNSWLPISLGVFFAALPDFMTLAKYSRTINILLLRLYFFHDWVQNHSDRPDRVIRGLLYQLWLIIVVLYIFLI